MAFPNFNYNREEREWEYGLQVNIFHQSLCLLTPYVVIKDSVQICVIVVYNHVFTHRLWMKISCKEDVTEIPKTTSLPSFHLISVEASM